MKQFFSIASTFWMLCFPLSALTVEEGMQRFLKGEKITAEEMEAITGRHAPAAEAPEIMNDGSHYLNFVKLSIMDPAHHGGWPYRIDLMDNERSQKKTYNELKAIYEKNKTPVVAYALVCPAMFVNDWKILPELFKKIEENSILKAHFDEVYTKLWKPRLDPDF